MLSAVVLSGDAFDTAANILSSVQKLIGPIFAIVVFILILKSISKSEFTIVGALVALGGAILVWVIFANFLNIGNSFAEAWNTARGK